MPKVLSHAFCQYVTVIVTSKYQVTINHKFIKVHFRPGIMDCILTWRSLCVGYWPLPTCFRSTQWWRQPQAMTQRKMGTRRMTVSLQGRGNTTAVCLLFVTFVLFFLLVSLYRGEVYLPHCSSLWFHCRRVTFSLCTDLPPGSREQRWGLGLAAPPPTLIYLYAVLSSQLSSSCLLQPS